MEILYCKGKGKDKMFLELWPSIKRVIKSFFIKKKKNFFLNYIEPPLGLGVGVGSGLGLGLGLSLGLGLGL